MENVRNEILKASVKHDRCEVTYKESFTEANFSNEVSKKCSQIVHVDLKNALDRLKIHLVILCEQPEAVLMDNIYDFDLEELSNYVVTGYSIGGSDESAGVTIIGQKLLKSGQVLNINAPFTKFEDAEAYEFAGELYGDVQACNWEVSEYLFAEKWGLKQQEFDFDVPEELSGAEITMAAPSTGKTKKIGNLKKSKVVEPQE
ncbi:hypothetical protein [Gaoshiqia sediminis]|uniref:Uncharacterized protein n=1 Tax=Gaoshiqia sediminis TaxID=2986998 RepID=A0AA41YAM2_9BACT|nr:hypothetical protein [Gaoshiqia sediminis]MCW0484093.1 hypothetical protein [Gaoshiqia sediminis]